MNDILEQLNRVRGVGGSVILSTEGLVIASCLRNDVDDEEISASVGSLIERAQNMCTRTGLGNVNMVHLQGDHDGVLTVTAGQSYLMIITDPHANLALLRLEARPYIDALVERLSL